MRHTRTMPVVGLAGLLFMGIGAGGCAQSDEGEPIASRSDPAYEHGTAWPSGKVDVCYDPTNGNNPDLLDRARALLDQEGWSAVAKIDFVGWGPCNATPPANGQIRVHFQTTQGAPGYNGSASHRGWKANTFLELWLVDDVANDPDYRHFNYEVLHEFGHAIGLAHEQTRPDNWDDDDEEIYCDRHQPGQTVITGGTYRTPYYDTQSVMSYCTLWSVGLSPGDVAAAQSMYGRRDDMWNGQNSSNHALKFQTSSPLLLGTRRYVFFVHNDRHLYRSASPGLILFGDDGWSTTALTTDASHNAPPGAPVAAISRKKGTIDVFYVGDDGGIHTATWTSGSAWSVSTLPGTYGKADPLSKVAAVAASPAAINVFWAGKDGNLYWSHWNAQRYPSAYWSDPVAIVDDKSVPRGADVTAVARTPDRLSVFYIGNDDSVHTASCYGSSGDDACFDLWTPQGSWGHISLGHADDCGAASIYSGISAVARTKSNIDVFYFSLGGTLCSNFWDIGTGWNGGYKIGTTGVASTHGHLAAISAAPHMQDVFFVGDNGQVYHAYSRLGPPGLRTKPTDWSFETISGESFSWSGMSLGAIPYNESSFDVFVSVLPTTEPILEQHHSHHWWGHLDVGDFWSWKKIN